MKNFHKELWFNILTRGAFVSITPQVEKCLQESAVEEGLALIKTMNNKPQSYSIPFQLDLKIVKTGGVKQRSFPFIPYPQQKC